MTNVLQQLLEQSRLEVELRKDKPEKERLLSTLDSARFKLGMHYYRSTAQYQRLYEAFQRAVRHLVEIIDTTMTFEDDQACLTHFGQKIPLQGLRSLFDRAIDRVRQSEGLGAGVE
jgi:hypothetical protein